MLYHNSKYEGRIYTSPSNEEYVTAIQAGKGDLSYRLQIQANGSVAVYRKHITETGWRLQSLIYEVIDN